jgi:xylan 1,4-beta-xylosidase
MLVWTYHDDSGPGEAAAVELEVSGLSGSHCQCTHFRIDGEHSNAHAVFLGMGEPRPPSADQYARLEHASQLEQLAPAADLAVTDGTVRLAFSLPRHAISLVRLRPA